MSENTSSKYLDSTRKLFRYYKSLGEKTFEQLDDTQIKWQAHEYSNNISTIVKHISGNMLSRWTDFLTDDGEKEWRNREQEFVDTIETKADLLAVWNKGWNCLFAAIDPLTKEDEERIIYIRNEGHTVQEAINRQLGHYAYHVGQIVFIGVQIKEKEWESLSIARGKSAQFNQEKFSKDKERKHFI